MSFSYEQNDKLNLQRTPSPGGDYDSLLNDSSTHKYNTEELENIREYSPIHSNQEVNSEIIKLRSENKLLRAQLEIITKEKELHVMSNAQDKNKNIRTLKNLREAMENEIGKIKRENEELMEKNKELMKKNAKIQAMKNDKVEFYKKQLESQESHYQILVKDKDRIIYALRKELQGKTSGKVTPKRKKMNSRKCSTTVSTVYTSPKESNLGFYYNPKQKLDEISQLIVKLEKEQAELKQTASDFPYDSERLNQFQSLRDITETNKKNFTNVRTQPRLHLKSRLSTDF